MSLINPFFIPFLHRLGRAEGGRKGWIDRYEFALASALILIPYGTHRYETSMLSSVRFVSIALPAYLIVGRLLGNRPPAVSSASMGLFSFLTGGYSAIFVQWYWVV